MSANKVADALRGAGQRHRETHDERAERRQNSSAKRIGDQLRAETASARRDEPDDELPQRLEGIDAAAGVGGHVVMETRPSAQTLGDQLRTRVRAS